MGTAISASTIGAYLNFIPTTATAAEKLKRIAKKQRKESGTSLAASLNAIAKANGYTSWKHVTQCLEQSTSARKGAAATLPPLLANLLNEAAQDNPPSAETRAAFRAGFAFAMDVKDAEGLNLGADLVECDEGWMLAASDILPVFVHAKNDEANNTLIDRLQGDDLIMAVQDIVMNYRIFRYTGAPVPASLDEAFACVLQRFFFPPTHVWLQGQFIDMDDVREVLVDGQVIYSTTIASQAKTLKPSPAPELSISEQPQPAVADMSRGAHDGIIPRLDIFKLQPGLYEYRLSYHGHEMMADAGFSSIREVIESAIDITGRILGFEIAYSGVTVGTFPFYELRLSAEKVAQQAIETVAAFRQY